MRASKALVPFMRYLAKRSMADMKKAKNYLFVADPSLLVSKGGIFSADMPSQNNDDFYWLEIVPLEKDLFIECECLAFENNGLCKHATGAVLQYVQSKLTDDDGKKLGYDAIIAAANAGWKGVFDTKGNLLQNKAIMPVADNGGDLASAPVVNLKVPKETTTKLASGFFQCKPSDIANHLDWVIRAPRFTNADLNKLETISSDPVNRFWELVFKETAAKQFILTFRFDGFSEFNHTCTCGKLPFCKHLNAAVFSIMHHDRLFFTRLSNTDAFKAKVLEDYGFKLNDPEASEFSVVFIHWGSPELVAPSWAVKLNDLKPLELLAKAFAVGPAKQGADRPMLPPNNVIDFELGFLINFNSNKYTCGFELEVLQLHTNKTKPGYKISKLNLSRPVNLALLQGLPDEVYALVKSLSEPDMGQYLTNHGFTSFNYYSSPWKHLSANGHELVRERQLMLLKALWPWLSTQPNVFILLEGKFAQANLKPAVPAMPFVELVPVFEHSERFITLKGEVRFCQAVDATGLETADTFTGQAKGHGSPLKGKWYRRAIFADDDMRLYFPEKVRDLGLLEAMPSGEIRLPAAQKMEVIQRLVPSLEKRFGKALNLPASLRLRTIHASPEPRLLLSEYMEKYLMLMPQFSYNGHVVDFSKSETTIFLQSALAEDIAADEEPAAQAIIYRNTEAETIFYESLRPLHPSFARQQQNHFYYLPFDQVMQNLWFINMLRTLNEQNIPVYGIDKLKKFRYSAHKPKWTMQAGSGNDWFDLNIEVKFGDETIPLKSIRKAFASGQNVIMLGDGSLGLLPGEWLKQYGTLLKMGDEKEPGVVRISKLHYTLIDALHGEIDDEAVLAELEEKKQKLQAIHTVSDAVLPKGIKAKLRPYQVSGFKWLSTLEQLGWGGCLADDMGLGKTLQTITFLQHVKLQFPKSTHLVFCPTSLLYNWENELRKFAPKLRFLVHYGLVRQLTESEVEEHDLIITSYGLVRSDIELLRGFEWHYLILDESQAIKNPDAITTRALHLLKAKNRLILSGTPLQNNTFDLYAQFNFLNPGMLGSREFFREEFATPIDRHHDKEKADTLRRLLYPFLRRRTKGQVAPDLPAKTETILWCEMPKAQRQVYDEYKIQYRHALLKKIDEVGVAKAGFLILEGLLRLRQICNSPQLLKQHDVVATDSVKIEELMREIEENTGGHKLLVFSQFTEMLHLIEAALADKGIQYAYLDGSTPADKRKAAVNRFQEDDATRVFLISLKAGGVGLNLTAADYVYLVDPWWNPAAEQQAIDRTHRIGQTQKVFAYKMICKDTVEEKILELQNRKRQLAGDLVSEDEAVAKNLSKEDVAFLFS